MHTVKQSESLTESFTYLESVDSFDSLSELMARGDLDFATINRELRDFTAEDRIRFLLRIHPEAVVTSSFGVQAAVTLSLAVKVKPEIPILFIDTQYHFPETYSYARELKDKLTLNLHTVRSPLSREEQEEKFGKLWLQGESGHRQYTLLNKIAPLNRGLDELGAGAWISGVRKSQSWTRSAAEILEVQDGRLKLHPIADWSDHEVEAYMKENRLYPHPLWYEGFKRVGDIHTTAYPPGWEGREAVSFSQRECGLHKRFAQIEEGGSGI